MSASAERPLDQALDDAVEFVQTALKRVAPVQGVIDLEPFDERAVGLTNRQRREIALAQLPSPIPLPIRSDVKSGRSHLGGQSRWMRRGIVWLLFLLTVITVFNPLISLGFGVAWLIALFWPATARTPENKSVTVVGNFGLGYATEFEIRIIWMARWQVAAVIGTRAWGSEELAGNAGHLDLEDVLRGLTTRALNLLRFTSTSLPKPSRSQPELRQQWAREQNRIQAIRTELIEQVAALIIYREHLELISELLDERDQLAIYRERAAAFDNALPLSGEGPTLLEAAHEQRDLHANLASQIRYLGELTDDSMTGLPLRGPVPEI